MLNLLYLHWGQITQLIRVDGIDPAAGNLDPSKTSGVIAAATGSGRLKPLVGRGKTRTLTGSSK